MFAQFLPFEVILHFCLSNNRPEKLCTMKIMRIKRKSKLSNISLCCRKIQLKSNKGVKELKKNAIKLAITQAENIHNLILLFFVIYVFLFGDNKTKIIIKIKI